MKDRIEYPPNTDIPRWFVYATHWVNKRVYCRRGHKFTIFASCNRCGEYAR